MAGLVLAREHDERPGIIWSDGSLSHAQAVQQAATRGAWLRSVRQPGPFHVAILADNSVEFLLWLEAAALVGAAVVGANPTHRGEELSRDLAHTQCQLLIVSEHYLDLVEGHDLGPAIGVVHRDSPRVVVIGSARSIEAYAAHGGARASEVADASITPSTLGYLLFTSGTSGAPKAVICSQGRLASISGVVPLMFSIGSEDVCYAAMPLFHSNALMANWGPSLAAGAAEALPTSGRFSASGFLPDVRRFGVTYFNYVGKPLSYILATPERPDDHDTTLRQCFGNEAAPDDIERFAERFGCLVTDAYGSSEGGAMVNRTPDTPPGSLGRAPEGTVVLDAETGQECPPAIFDDGGRLLNADECIGELVSKTGGTSFEGYWHNEEAMTARLREGWYWTGDLAYRDTEGFFYFAGRDHDWIRVDGENFAAAPIERILQRHPDIVLAAVYAVPDRHVGDQVMAAIELAEGASTLDADELARFLRSQEDLGTKWAPKYVRIVDDLPKTATSKIVKKSLRAERWNAADPIWVRESSEISYAPLSEAERLTLNEAVSSRVL
jgi:fatty-acyl-CoA synthase